MHFPACVGESCVSFTSDLSFLGDALLYFFALPFYDIAETCGLGPCGSFLLGGLRYGRVCFSLQGGALLLHRHLQVHRFEVHHLRVGFCVDHVLHRLLAVLCHGRMSLKLHPANISMCLCNSRLRFGDYCSVSANNSYVELLVQLVVLLEE